MPFRELFDVSSLRSCYGRVVELEELVDVTCVEPTILQWLLLPKVVVCCLFVHFFVVHFDVVVLVVLVLVVVACLLACLVGCFQSVQLCRSVALKSWTSTSPCPSRPCGCVASPRLPGSTAHDRTFVGATTCLAPSLRRLGETNQDVLRSQIFQIKYDPNFGHIF